MWSCPSPNTSWLGSGSRTSPRASVVGTRGRGRGRSRRPSRRSRRRSDAVNEVYVSHPKPGRFAPAKARIRQREDDDAIVPGLSCEETNLFVREVRVAFAGLAGQVHTTRRVGCPTPTSLESLQARGALLSFTCAPKWSDPLTARSSRSSLRSIQLQ